MDEAWFQDIIIENDTKLVLLVMDGLGGLPYPGKGQTERLVLLCENDCAFLA